MMSAFAQSGDYREITPLAKAPADPLWCGAENSIDPIVPVDSRCKRNFDLLGFDKQTQMLIYWRAGSDCHMKAITKVFRSDREKRIRVVVNSIYGGCRAGGWLAGFITIEKSPPDYHVSVEVIGVDSIHNRQDRDGIFKLPPDLRLRAKCIGDPIYYRTSRSYSRNLR